MSERRLKNYYELFDISSDATKNQIVEAYKKAKATYEEDSVAVYSLYSSNEREEILEEINMAYEILKDNVKRNEYDNNLAEEENVQTIMEDADNKKDISEIGELDFLARLKQELIVSNGRDPMAVEQYRVLYTRLEQARNRKTSKAFAVTSAVKGEGKTATSFNLAYVMAKEFRNKVILVECDLKNPSLRSSYLDNENQYGLVDVLNGDAELEDAIVQLESTELYILPVRQNVKNSSELLSSQRMNELLITLKKRFDYVIIDSPPILHLADMNILSRMVDGLLLVVRAGKTPKDLVKKAVNSITDGKFVGIVLNGADTPLGRYEGYEY
jgi:capsular exopolysaccharide synthesis family protein